MVETRPPKGTALRTPRHLAVITLTLALGSVPAFAATAGRYTGRTADKRPVSFTVRARRVRSFTMQTRFRCSDGTGFVATAKFLPMRIRRNRFNATFHNTARSLRTTIKGVIRGRKVTGTIRRRATFNSSRKLDPHGTLTCTVSTRYSARR